MNEQQALLTDEAKQAIQTVTRAAISLLHETEMDRQLGKVRTSRHFTAVSLIDREIAQLDANMAALNEDRQAMTKLVLDTEEIPAKMVLGSAEALMQHAHSFCQCRLQAAKDDLIAARQTLQLNDEPVS